MTSTIDRDLGDSLPATIKENGGWCWFQDDRAICAAGQLIVGSVSAADRGGSRPGDIDITSLDLTSGNIRSFKLACGFDANDHAAPALLSLPDGRIMAAYTRHHKSPLLHWRITTQPGDIAAWGGEQSFDAGARATYSNLFSLEGESGAIYHLHRGLGFNPNAAISTDNGRSFQYRGRLLDWPRPVGDPRFTGLDGGRPYVKYASNQKDSIHFITTEDHPWAYDNSVYHGVLGRGKILRTNGEAIADFDARGVSPRDLTRVFTGDAGNVAWTSDLRLDATGNPVALFSIQKGGRIARGVMGSCGQDHRYGYASWDGGSWHAYEITYAGTSLGTVDGYTGLAVLDPLDPSTVVISTNADPMTGAPLMSRADGLRHHELFEGRTRDTGKSWDWKALTRDSNQDNIRPVIPAGPPDKRLILWLRGTYRTWTDYDLDVTMLVRRRPEFAPV